jgi:hypothetical protein
MNGFNSDLWDWLLQRSPIDAATPDVRQRPDDNITPPFQPSGRQPIETSVNTFSVLGLPLKTGSIDRLLRTVDGELSRIHDDTVLLLACGHFGAFNPRPDQKENKIKKITAQCFYCWQQLQEQALESMPFDKLVREFGLTLVCEECERRTTEGHLSCPKHSEEDTKPDGIQSFLSLEDAKEKERLNTMKTILGFIASFFSQSSSDNPTQNSQESNHV